MEDLFGKYKLVLGLEIHIEPKTKRKMFCRCSADIWQAEPNTHTCPSCLGLPGALPVPNLEAIRKTQLLGLVLNCTLSEHSRFDRKHYFYPDLPKGYQISQYKQPVCIGGYIDLDSGTRVELERIHIEEDTAKSSHEGGKTLIDFNMSSMPLIEIVTTPCFKTIEDAVEFGKKIKEIVRALGLGDADMEKGQMRLEPNISLRIQEMEGRGELPKYKVEIKNINSFRFMEKAITAEVKRQRALLEKGETPLQENRGYIETTQETISQRSKEDAQDYRYFPEPDIPPMIFDKNYMEKLKAEFESLSKNLPGIKVQQLVSLYAISQAQADSLSKLNLIEKFEELVKIGQDTKSVANNLINKPATRELSVQEYISMSENVQVKIVDIESLEQAARKIISENPEPITSYKAGKDNALQFLIGMVMRETKGKADASTVKDILTRMLR